jgi:GT2 family glycosyltransferase
MSNAPILLFTYKRLATLKQTVAALQNNPMAKESDLFIFSDGAKYESDEIIVAQIRDYLNEISGFKSLKIIKAEKNKGLANSIIDGVTQVMELYEHVIVLEDDLITTPNFLDFMNSCLNKYRASEEVFSISGYSFNLGKEPGNENDNYFLTRGWSWGWAT